MNFLKKQRLHILSAAIIVLLLFSCESTPVVLAEIPQPAVEQVQEQPEVPQPEQPEEAEIPEIDSDESPILEMVAIDSAVIAEPEFELLSDPNGDDVLSESDVGNGSDVIEENMEPLSSVPEQHDAVDQKASATSDTTTSTEPDTPVAASSDTLTAETDTDDANVPGIWEYEPALPAESAVTNRAEINDPSRSVTAFAGTLLEVRYPGKGWVFLGDVSNRGCVTYRTKQMDNGDSLFLFMPSKTGTSLLSFFRFDTLKDEYEDDILQVTVIKGETADKRVSAPQYVPAPLRTLKKESADADADAVPQHKTEDAESYTADSISDEPELELGGDTAQPVSTETHADFDAMSAAELLLLAEDSCEKKQPKTVIEISLVYASKYSDQLDYIWYLTGQAYEMPGEMRNMKKALECYETVISAFPFSSYGKKAAERSGYIKRFYFTIR